MRSFKLFSYAKFLAAASILSLTFYACDKDDDDKDPAYVGVWSRTETIYIDTLTLDFKDVLTLTKNTFTDIGKVQNPDTDEWIDLMGMKGTLSASGNNLDVSLTEIGLSDFDTEGIPTGDIVYYNTQDEEFDALLYELDQEGNFDAAYSVAGNQLTIKIDDNNDGDVLDDGETQVFTKE
jgi:hypothetical protein